MSSALITRHTTCPYCGVGCGIEATVDVASRQVLIKGDNQHPANFGRLCSKGSALAETLSTDTRLLQPSVSGQNCSWDDALDYVAQELTAVIEQYGPDAVALYASGQLLTEDYYVANKWLKGFVGTANIDTNSRLCMSSSVAGHKRAFGSDTVPGCYADYEQAELLVLIGSNAAWCHPVSYQRIRAAKAANPAVQVIVIDPRLTASCDIADLHLPLAVGSDVALFNGLLLYLQQQGRIDQSYIDAHTEGFATCLHSVQAYDIPTVAGMTQLPSAVVEQFYLAFAQTERVMSLYSQGVNQSASGVDKVNSILNCHLATGRIGKPGMGPFSLTGQPNAMGGREVGGLSHQLAAHMEFSNPDDRRRVASFWGTDRLASRPGLSAIELFDAVDDGRIKAVWIMGTNPVVSLPDADKVKRALQRCPLVIVSDCVARTDTTQLADVLLPAAPWSEKAGTVTNSERRISRQRALVPLTGEARPDWWIISQVASRMGYADAFNYQHPRDIFVEHAALSGYENDEQHGVRDFDLSGLAGLSLEDYEAMQPLQWPVNAQYPQGRARLFADGQFYTSSGKAQFIAVHARSPVNPPNAEYPLRLNTGRIRDQWHTMTRTALAARLNQHRPEPFVEIHPSDALQYGLKHQGLADIKSRWGRMLARVEVTDAINPGNVFVPMHWSQQFASAGRMGVLVNPVLDPISKQPESKHTPVAIRSLATAWEGVMITVDDCHLHGLADYWVKIPAKASACYRLAGLQVPLDWQTTLKTLLAGNDLSGEWLSYQDLGRGDYRLARVVNGQLRSVVFIGRTLPEPDIQWLQSLCAGTTLNRRDRLALLSGHAPEGESDQGPVICACFNVGKNQICQAIRAQQLTDYQQVGQATSAGTNCGSCIPDIKSLIALARTSC